MDARKWTDKELKELEARIKAAYKEALDGITGKFTSFLRDVQDKIDDLQTAYDEAKASGDEKEIRKAGIALSRAKREKTLQSDQYKRMIEATTKKIAEANETAIAYANGKLPGIYVRNFNAARIAADEVGVDFGLVNERAVKNAILEGDIKLPYKKLNIPKDMQWNTKKLNSAVLQGILQGESMQEIAERIFPIVGENAAAAIRNARTMVTGAENRGKQDSYEDLQERGVVLKKVWIATPDERTRQSHLDLDGVAVELDEKFPNGLRYPGDPEGDPGEVYNCRCSLITKVIGFRKPDGRIEKVDIDPESKLHKEQIEKEKEEREKHEKQEKEEKSKVVPEENADKTEEKLKIDIALLRTDMGDEEYERYIDLVASSDYDAAYVVYGGKLKKIVRQKTAGEFSSYDVSIKYDYVNRKGMSRYSTLAHELSHFFDYACDTDGLGLTFEEIDKINGLQRHSIQILKRTPSQCDSFLAALREDMSHPSIFDSYKEPLYDAFGGVQDACSGFYPHKTKYLYGWGHDNAYYNRRYKRATTLGVDDARIIEAYRSLGIEIKRKTAAKLRFRHYDAASEAWANIGSALVCGGDELTAVEKYLPKATAEMRRILKEIKKKQL